MALFSCPLFLAALTQLLEPATGPSIKLLSVLESWSYQLSGANIAVNVTGNKNTGIFDHDGLQIVYCRHLHYITLHYITLHYITLHYITLHYITLHVKVYLTPRGCKRLCASNKIKSTHKEKKTITSGVCRGQTKQTPNHRFGGVRIKPPRAGLKYWIES